VLTVAIAAGVLWPFGSGVIGGEVLQVSDLTVNMGVGQTTVVLPDEGRFQAKIDGAIGSISIRRSEES